MLLRLVCSAPLSTDDGGVFSLWILFLSVLSSSVLTSSTPGPAFPSPEAGAGGVSSHLPSSQSQLSIAVIRPIRSQYYLPSFTSCANSDPCSHSEAGEAAAQ